MSVTKHIGNDYFPGQLRSTKSYIFKTDEVLGEGATCKVFLARNKKIGEKVAVKVFNNTSFDRPNAVQAREFDVLLKIQHKNIVRLLAIENDQITKQRIIIMELCNCSVLNMLEKPEYLYGFPEEEFLIVLGDTTSGMKYLQEQGIVHRDIKPGNIMQKLGSDRKTIYKLADFGAARQLNEDENFYSLYGTEEYIHPHMFERALLKRPLFQAFTAKVDLWSLGITIYHIATGVLPFRPFGGRKNRNTMHKITTQKARGVISAVQKQSEDGPIEYKTELPTNCRLSMGLKLLITDMLAGLLESDTEVMWSFEKFFETTQLILCKRAFDVLCVSAARLIRVYVDPNSSYAEFQEHIAVQTNISSDTQMLIYDDALFHPDLSVLCASYPMTSEDNPVFLIPLGFNGSGSPVPPVAPSMPEIKSNYSLDADYSLSRITAAVVHCLQRKQNVLMTISSTFNAVVKANRYIFKNQILQLTIHVADVNSKKQSVENSLKSVEEKNSVSLKLLDALLVGAYGSMRDKGDFIQLTLTGVQSELNQTRHIFQMVTSKQHEAKCKLKACEEGYKSVSWKPTQRCRPDDRCRERLDVIREDIEEISRQYRQDKKSNHLGYNEIQLHKMDKLKLKEKATLAESLITEHCENYWRESHAQLMIWFQQFAPVLANIRSLDSLLLNLIDEYPSILEEVEAKCAIWKTRIHNSNKRLSELLKNLSRRQMYEITSNPPLQLSGTTVGQLQVDCDSGHEQLVIYHPPKSPETQSPPELCSGASNHANTGTVINIQRSLKREFEAFDETNIDRTEETIKHSQKLMKQLKDESQGSQAILQELQDMSLGIPDPPNLNLFSHIDDRRT